MIDDAAALDDEAFADRLADIDAGIDAGLTPDSDLSPRLRRGVNALQALRKLRNPGPTLAFDAAPTFGAAAPGPAPQRIGRFHIRRELGRGGFGIVFLAHDPQLHRDVAIKVPHPGAMIDPVMRDRFRREARAAAGLDHPNIVPVYEVDDSGPVLLLVAAYCPGESLAQWLGRQKTPVPPQVAARLVAALADGVSHAHSRGVLHRDVKPSNILLNECEGAEPRPLITDFGLAKLVDDDGGATRSGAILGTPAYMSPEQAMGRAATQACDVYALGAVLYELLTSRPPLRGETDVETLQLVTTTEPIAPRQLRPKLPRDLETVCLKCLEKDPGRRYASAGDLRDDLQRYLAGVPVLARPVTPVGRVVRWCRRKPLVAGLSAALAFAVIAGVAGMTREYRRANDERDAAFAARDKTERVLTQSRVALQQMIDFGQSQVHDKAMVPATIHILKMARDLYTRLAAEDPENWELRSQAATICRRLGVVYETVGPPEAADEAFAAARDLTEALLAQRPDDNDLRVELYSICQLWAKALQSRGDTARADPLLDRAIELAGQDAAKSEARASTIIALALSTYHRGESRRRRGDLAGAESDFRKAIALHAPLEKPTDSTEFRRFLTVYYLRLAGLLVGRADFEEAEPLVVVVQDRLDTFGNKFQDDDRRELQTNCWGFRARIRFAQKRWAEAERLFADANQQVAPFVATKPIRLAYPVFFARNVWYRARALEQLGRKDEATAYLLEALRIDMPAAEQSVKHPSVDWLECHIMALDRLAALPDARQRVAAKAREWLEATRIWPGYEDVNKRLEAALGN
ncbi:MAG: serine/threonine protein kinase [Gemmataceae bacterium]|nr:serine/threonine protein kinase [Gemmataceae bacterium]